MQLSSSAAPVRSGHSHPDSQLLELNVQSPPVVSLAVYTQSPEHPPPGGLPVVVVVVVVVDPPGPPVVVVVEGGLVVVVVVVLVVL